MPKAGLRALSVLFTLFSLLLSSYLLMWLYDGQGFDPVLIAVGEAAIALKDLPADDPWELLFWGLALVTAFGVTRSEGPGDEDQVLDDAPPPDERSLALGNLEPTLREAAGSQAVRGSSAGRPNLRSEAPLADPSPRALDLPTADDPTHVPARVSARPVDRFVWSGVMSVCGVFWLTLGAQSADDPETPLYFFPLAVTIAMVGLLSAATGLRMGLVADEQGITLCRPITTSRILWTDLKGVELEARNTEINVGLHRLVLVTREQPRVPAGFMGRAQDGAPLPELRRTLLAMRQRYLTTAPGTPETAPGVRPAGTGAHARPGSEEPVDRVSLAALVLSVLGVVVAAAPLALWGIARGGPGPRRGRDLAMAALCICALWVIAASALLVGTGLVGGPPAPDQNASLVDAQPVFWSELHPQMCVRASPMRTGSGPPSSTAVCRTTRRCWPAPPWMTRRRGRAKRRWTP